ncbi:hypothetical protein C8T65DRAFT_655228 [Cerioporus squamosus]|nr:hypothetical protein C8T65DRAFT_655228 [Cerioporus squamosus]
MFREDQIEEIRRFARLFEAIRLQGSSDFAVADPISIRRVKLGWASSASDPA